MEERPPPYQTSPQFEVRREARLPLNHPQYVAPTPVDVRTAVQHSGRSGAELAHELGMGGRRIREYQQDREIPAAAWRLLLIVTGLALDENGERLELVQAMPGRLSTDGTLAGSTDVEHDENCACDLCIGRIGE
jgi:hypothetical protein